MNDARAARLRRIAAVLGAASALLAPVAYAAGAPTPEMLADMLFDAKTNGEHACAGQFCRRAPATRSARPASPRSAMAPWPEPESEAKSGSPPERARRWTPQLLAQIVRAAGLNGVDPYLVQAVVQVESNFDPRAVSPRNARGLMQVLPSTASQMGLQPAQRVSVAQRLHDPWTGLLMGSRYLAEQLAQFDGEVKLALAAYNAGPGAVLRSGRRVPPYRETQAYVRKVLRAYDELKAAQTLRDAPV